MHTEREFIKYLSNAGFKIPSDYKFESIWDDEDNCDGGKLIFDINKTDLPTLINAVKKFPQINICPQIPAKRRPTRYYASQRARSGGARY